MTAALTGTTGEGASDDTESETLIFIPLALKQARFFGRLAESLREAGVHSAFICLHEPSVGDLRARGFEVVNFWELVQPLDDYSVADARRIAAGYGMDNLNRALSHEKRFYELTDSVQLTRKLAAYLEAMDRALDALRPATGGQRRVVQELGGFVSVLASFAVAQRHGIPMVFIEPSFFRGRMFFITDSLAALRVPTPAAPAIDPAMQAYLDETRRDRKIVIPHKDQGEYRAAWRKILNMHNVRRLVEKTVQKHVRREREQFDHISTYVRKHLRMLRESARLRSVYSELPDQPFVYYPLHVPGDLALTLRSPEYLDQFSLIDYIARNVPADHLVAVKEHPAMVGAFESRRLRELLRQHDNLRLLRPTLNNLDVIQRSAAVVTVNSKSGAEALMLERPVVVLGDAFYRDFPHARAVDALSGLAATVRQAVREPAPPRERVDAFFQSVWDHSYPGELYNADPANCDTFAESLMQYLARGAEVRG